MYPVERRRVCSQTSPWTYVWRLFESIQRQCSGCFQHGSCCCQTLDQSQVWERLDCNYCVDELSDHQPDRTQPSSHSGTCSIFNLNTLNTNVHFFAHRCSITLLRLPYPTWRRASLLSGLPIKSEWTCSPPDTVRALWSYLSLAYSVMYSRHGTNLRDG